MAIDKKLTAVPLADVRELKYVDEGKFYTCQLQLGPSISHRQYRPGKWTKDMENSSEGKDAYKADMNCCNVGPIPGSGMNGMISEHNLWVAHNAARDVRGNVNYMFVLSNIVECAPPPASLNGGFMLNSQLMAAITEATKVAAIAAVEAILAADSKKPPK